MKVDTRSLVAVAVAAGLSVALSFLRLFQMPQGGSITLEALPILYLALWRGAGYGVGAGVLSGLVQLLLRPYVVHPIQILLDYPLALGVLGVAGLFRGVADDRAMRVGLSAFFGVALIATAGVQWFELSRAGDLNRVVLSQGDGAETVLSVRPDTTYGDLAASVATTISPGLPGERVVDTRSTQGETARRWLSQATDVIGVRQIELLGGTLLFLVALGGLYLLARNLSVGAASLGVLIAMVGKFACHVVSGAVFFGAYAPAGQNVWVYSAVYNATYVLPQAALALFLVPPIVRRLSAGTE